MNHRATPRFWHCYHRLPAEVQRLADSCYELLQQDSRDPSLHLKKIGRLWSVRGAFATWLARHDRLLPGL